MRTLAVTVGIAAATLLPFACGGSGGFPTPDAGEDGPLLDPDGPTLGDAASDVLACRRCSSDRHAVLDCQGNTLETCTGVEGCDDELGACANACQVAVQRKQSVGCEYYATFMEMLQGGSRCFAAFVANTWNTPAHLQLDRSFVSYPIASFARIPKGVGQAVTYQPYVAQNGLAPGEVAILFLGGLSGASPLCPIPSAGGQAPMIVGTGRGFSFRIRSDVPVVAYEMDPYGGGSAAITGASLLLPTSAWDTNYVATTASQKTTSSPSIDVIATEDATQVTLLPSVGVDAGGGLPGGPANAPLTFVLNRGEFAQFTQEGDLAGSILQANRPIGVMSGNPCMNWPLGRIYCDHGEQMLPPVRALGNEYVGVAPRPRIAGDVAGWRLVGAVDGTTLSWLPSTPPGAPTTLQRGQVVELSDADPFVVASQDDAHPFLLFTLMSGNGGTGPLSGYGDPDHVLSVPPRQYLDDYVFFTDPTFPETNLVVVRKPVSPGVFADVELDCAGKLGGWKPIGDYEWTRVDLETGDFQGVNGCENGRHEMKSKAPFGLWIWGWGTPTTTSNTRDVSYGYPGGMNVQPINKVIVPPTPK